MGLGPAWRYKTEAKIIASLTVILGKLV